MALIEVRIFRKMKKKKSENGFQFFTLKLLGSLFQLSNSACKPVAIQSPRLGENSSGGCGERCPAAAGGQRVAERASETHDPNFESSVEGFRKDDWANLKSSTIRKLGRQRRTKSPVVIMCCAVPSLHLFGSKLAVLLFKD
jgi:hypothetical protein